MIINVLEIQTNSPGLTGQSVSQSITRFALALCEIGAPALSPARSQTLSTVHFEECCTRGEAERRSFASLALTPKGGFPVVLAARHRSHAGSQPDRR